MNAEAVAHVDAWMLEHDAWAMQSETRIFLFGEWRRTVRLSSIAPEWSDGIRAILGGILLALVRQAWGDAGAYASRSRDGSWTATVASCNRWSGSRRVVTVDGERWVGHFPGADEFSALVGALIAYRQAGAVLPGR